MQDELSAALFLKSVKKYQSPDYPFRGYFLPGSKNILIILKNLKSHNFSSPKSYRQPNHFTGSRPT